MLFRNKNGLRPLGAASHRGHAKVVELLIEEGADVNPDFHEDSIASGFKYLIIIFTLVFLSLSVFVSMVKLWLWIFFFVPALRISGI